MSLTSIPKLIEIADNQPTKLVVAIDIDEVIAQFLPSMAQFHNEIYGTSYTMESFHSYDFTTVWGGTMEETSTKVRDFFDSGRVLHLDPVPGALEALTSLQADFELHIVTARQQHAEELTKKWINRHFPNIFTDIHFGNHYSNDGKSRSKAEICRSIGSCLLVDDNLSYARNCAHEGIPAILFGNYNWNRPTSADTDLRQQTSGQWMIQEAHSWTEVVELVYSRLGATSRSSTLASTAQSNRKTKVAAIQLCSGNDREANLKSIDRLVAEAASNGARLVCLPECCSFMGSQSSELLAVAEYVDNSLFIQSLAAMATNHKIWLSIGGFPEKCGDDKVYNTHVLVDPAGVLQRPNYRKIHLFDNPLTGLKESAVTGRLDDITEATLICWLVDDQRLGSAGSSCRRTCSVLACLFVMI